MARQAIAPGCVFSRSWDLPNGIPSHDTFNKVLATADAFERRTQQWVHALFDLAALCRNAFHAIALIVYRAVRIP